jgi:hypothetical protein
MKLLITTIGLVSSLLAVDFTTQYDVEVGMFGKVGVADIALHEDKSSYEITLSAKLIGTAASLTGNRVETYISKGKIIEGQYIPDTFKKITTSDELNEELVYNFNHATQTVNLDTKTVETIKGTSFDAMSFKIIETKEVKKSSSTEVLENYVSSDILSSYLNTRKSCNALHTNYDLVAIGARNDRNNITVSFLDSLQKADVKKSFSADIGNIYNLNVKPLDKDNTTVNILMAFDNDGLMKEAVLGDAFWIGEIRAKRVYHDVASK